MASFRMVLLGNPILRQKSKEVSLTELQSKAFQEKLDKLENTLTKGLGVGIAAPQVGISKRVIVVSIESKRSPQYNGKKEFPLQTIINPKIVTKSKEIKEDWEGDLSADIRGLVPRSLTCVVSGGIEMEKKLLLIYKMIFMHAFFSMKLITWME